LIGNVEKYAAAGGCLEIVSKQNDSSTQVYVKDKGPGIPPGEGQRIFAPFYRISNNLTDGVSGAGIGLAVSRTLARMIGGSLTLESGGPGAVFKLELPKDATGR
jgi:two-component system sensor histidine kinase GlrK